MPILQVNNTSIWYESHGEGPETIVFSHGLLWSGEMFHYQESYFKDRYRIITFDHRGQGKTPGKAPYDMDTLSEDAIALIQTLCDRPVHFAGLSMGGFVGMRIAARRPDLIKSLILLETSAAGEALANVPKYGILNLIVRFLGIQPVVPAIKKIMFGESFLKDPAKREELSYWEGVLSANNPKTITKAVEGVIYRKPVLPELHRIKCPTLILTGEEDVATPIPKGQQIQQHIKGSTFVRIPKAGHSSTIETPEAVNKAIEAFLQGL
jgi:3-oxoadipate enol-lactonase